MKSDISWTTWRTPEQSNLIPRDLEKPGAYCTRFLFVWPAPVHRSFQSPRPARLKRPTDRSSNLPETRCNVAPTRVCTCSQPTSSKSSGTPTSSSRENTSRTAKRSSDNICTMNQFCPASNRLKYPRTAAPFRLDHLLKERQGPFQVAQNLRS